MSAETQTIEVLGIFLGILSWKDDDDPKSRLGVYLFYIFYIFLILQMTHVPDGKI